MTGDPYRYWRDLLAGTPNAIPLRDGQPECGFYRRRLVRGGPFVPVALWRDERGAMQCAVGAEYRPADPDETWLYCCSNPVSEADYRAACNTGLWPGDAPATAAAAVSNNPPSDAEALPQAIEEAVARAKAWLDGRAINSQADADKCETFVAELSKLAKAADEERERLVRPHLDAQRDVNARWKPIVTSAEAAVRAVKTALAPFLKAREAEKKAAAAAAVIKGEEPRSDTRAMTSGLAGRRVSLRTVTKARVTDWEKAAVFFASNSELQAVIQKLANKVASVGGDVPGAEIVKEQVAA